MDDMEGKPVKGSLNKIDEMGISTAVFDPCSISPKNGDFMSVMQQNEALPVLTSALGAVRAKFPPAHLI
jgi:hypothetical protein